MTKYIPWLICAISLLGAWYLREQAYTEGASHEKALCGQADAERQLAQEREITASLKSQLSRANQQLTLLRQDTRAIQARNQSLEKEIDHVTQHYKPSPGADLEPLPACVFTRGFVGLYNDAISYPGLPANSTAGAAAGAVGEAEPAAAAEYPLTPANIGQADILSHINNYGTRCLSIEAQLVRLIDLVKPHQAQAEAGQ